MKSALEQLSSYKSVHLNPVNIGTHFIGVPLIIWSVLLALSLLRIPFVDGTELSVAMLVALAVLLYYFKLHWRLALGVMFVIAPMLYSASLIADMEHALALALAVFIFGWLFQLLGHKYERAKPAFIDDFNQLLIGPLFLMAEVYFMLGWQRSLKLQITPLAVSKRRVLEAERGSK